MDKTDRLPRFPESFPPARHFFSRCESKTGIPPYTPPDIVSAYALDRRTTGKGVTAAVIEAFDAPHLAEELATFSKAFGLPETTLPTVHPFGYPASPVDGWETEAAADVEWLHACAPDARLFAVFAPDDSVDSLMKAALFAAKKGADVISMSFGAAEFPGQTAFSQALRATGKVFVAAAGDAGGAVLFPASSDAVTAVGGTVLHRARGKIFARSAWPHGGGGLSRYTARPVWQTVFAGIPGDTRAVPDVALDACDDPGYAVYRAGDGWLAAGGTSLAAPVMAGLYAQMLEADKRCLAHGAAARLYALAGGTAYEEPQTCFHDVTVGSNGKHAAGKGYDLCTGLGAPVGRRLIREDG